MLVWCHSGRILGLLLSLPCAGSACIPQRSWVAVVAVLAAALLLLRLLERWRLRQPPWWHP